MPSEPHPSTRDDGNLVTVKVGVMLDMQEFKIRKDLLEEKSPVLLSRVENEERPEISLTDVSVRAFSLFSRWLDGEGFCPSSFEEALETINLSVRYEIRSLAFLCERYVKDRLTFVNVILAMDTYWNTRFDNEIINLCLCICERETANTLESEAFVNANAETVATISRCPRLILRSEADLFRAMVRWGKAECARYGMDPSKYLRAVLGNILPHVRFLDMSLEEFLSVVVPEKILTANEEETFLARMLSADHTPAVPIGFFESSESRVYEGYGSLTGTVDETCNASFLPLPLPIMPKMEFYVTLKVISGILQVDKIVFCSMNERCPSLHVKLKFKSWNTHNDERQTTVFEGNTSVEESKLVLKCPLITAHGGDIATFHAVVLNGPCVYGEVYYRRPSFINIPGLQVQFRHNMQPFTLTGTFGHQLSELLVFYKREKPILGQNN